ncbi:MAG: thiamine phosphate synthase [Deltaproteobacteria bacterium]|nr:thiamine phosphate synthase [Deltaproteobacteria bacterium]
MNGLYLVTDRNCCGPRLLDRVVLEALKGGCMCVQLREKNLPTRPFIEEAQRIKAILAPFRVPLIINDRLDVALAVGADGLHIGQDDMPYTEARKWLGPEAIIGLSVEKWADVEQAQDLDVDYLGVSPVFQTPTKTDTTGAWGLDGIKKIRSFSRHPLVAIGGLNAGNVKDAVMAGADGIAVVSAICAASDPYQAACELDSIIRDALKNRNTLSQ